MRFFIDIKIDRIVLEREYEKLIKGSVNLRGLKKPLKRQNKLLYGKSMLRVDELRITLAKALDDLSLDEWAAAQWRDDVVEKIDSLDAFDSILPVLELASEQTDSYSFESCCSLALQLAVVAQTTEHPKNLVSILKSLREHELQLALNDSKVKELAKWFRVSNAI
ncbi:hypothetical protein ABFY09_05565 [Marinomonas sp. 5E14-1]|uniref:hypothetical protein n=1 Tax=Marinomonas sp. 5E14-1 TaxID=3153922 RepID=UPI0032641FCB